MKRLTAAPDVPSHNRAAPTQRHGDRSRPTPVGFEQRLLARARAAGFERGDRLVVGFSGGRDSLALAAGLRWVRDVLGVQPLCVHFDHRLRKGSGDEASRAEALAGELGLDFEALAATAMVTELHPHVGTEEAGRRERYRLLSDTARVIDARALVTAHHLQDQAETVLLHLLRGSGVHGASAMREWSPVPTGPPALNDISRETGREPVALWRPLLREPRGAIDDYVASLGLAWIEDPSNTDPSLRRNAVRYEIMPLLESRFPGAAAALARYAELAAGDDEALELIAAEALMGGVDPGGRLRAETLSGLPLGLRRRVVRQWLAQATGSRETSADRIDAMLRLVESRRGRRSVDVGDGWRVTLRQGLLIAELPGSTGRRGM